MKKVFIFIFLLLSCSLLFAENKNNSISKTAVRLELQEFAYPIIPNAGKMVVNIPFSLFTEKDFLSRTNTRVWYLASSPLFIPYPFYEVGITAEYILAKMKTSNFSLGLGTAFSRDYGVTSIPLIISVREKWFPLNWLELHASLENLLYGEGDIIDIQLMATFKPFNYGLLFQIGGTGAVAYGWTKSIFAYSYGLSAGIGYLF